MNLGQLYNASKDPAQALRHVDEAASSADALRPRMRSQLHFTRAQVLVNLDRLADAQAAFQRALEIARAGGIDVMETYVLGNMADLALRRHRWREAEQLARDALAVASRSHNESAALMARANLGFALGGQGNIGAARPLVDSAIAKFREDGNLQALSAMLDEKASLLERVGLYKEGMAVLREQQALERRQFTVDRANAVAALQDKIADAENHRRIQQLQEENRLKDADIRNRELKQLALALVALLMLAVGGFVFVLYRRAGESNSQLRELNTKLEYHAERDALTGLYNRRSFVEKMRADTAVTPVERRRADAPASDIYMILDIDHFKRVNDTHGHGAGDQVLVEVAQRLQQAVRAGDTVLRWGGEEFVIHFRGKQGAPAAMLGARILAAIGGAPIQAGSVALDITASAGLIELPLAGVPPSTLDWERAIALADMALYRAKSAGRNQCCHVIGLANEADAGHLAELEPVQALALLETTTIAGPLRPA
ncbi:tetratricopeptide repeat-containing diguanylate cyclase [Pseudoduganella lutea]|uniref:diguanylate cyclase n=1 Tax=Pseudoduganella lutea TaxID=321985 RepID=A0A4P6KTQ2_9BURK|nr:tetratricopeptide repeat-containing diguanylate cyclase [Pseudoduganella lutea]QBE61955.1 diguanylate cyclase [Pseudoduganella lutea]